MDRQIKRTRKSKTKPAEPVGSAPHVAAEKQARIDEFSSQKGKKDMARRKRTADKEAAAAAEVPVTEQPVPSAPVSLVTQYVVTVDNETGIATQVQRLDEKTGERKELSADEYAAMYSLGTGMSSLSFSAPGETFASDELLKAYYQGVSDYLQALTKFG
jgi:hypothetical protein